MRILDLYIVRKFITTYLFIIIGLAIIATVIDFTENVDDFIEKKVPYKEIFGSYYVNFIIFVTNLLSPICIFLAVLLFTARLAQQTEITAILSAGISFYRLLLPYLVCALGLWLVTFFLNAYWTPDAVRKMTDFKYEYIKKKSIWDARNIHGRLDKHHHVYFYSYNQFNQTGQQFCLERYDERGLVKKLWAEKAEYRAEEKQWRLLSITESNLINGQWITSKRKAFALDTILPLKPEDIFQRENFAESLNLPDLQAYISQEEVRGSDFLFELVLEENERYAFPFASVILTLLGFALASKKRRGGVALQLGLGFVLTFVYVLVLLTAKVAIGEYFPAWLAVWLPNILFFVIAVLLVRFAPK